MQSPRNISDAIKPICRSAIDRAIESFEENGGILSTGKAIVQRTRRTDFPHHQECNESDVRFNASACDSVQHPNLHF